LRSNLLLFQQDVLEFLRFQFQYLHYNIKFLNYTKNLREIVNEDIKRYLANKEVSNATLSLAINVLKFYYT
jgi:hypothetical protein